MRSPPCADAAERQARFEAVYAANRALILGYALRRTANPDDAADILAELGLSGGLADTAVALATPAPRVPPPDLSGLQLTLWSHLTAQPQHVDALVASARSGAADVLGADGTGAAGVGAADAGDGVWALMTRSLTCLGWLTPGWQPGVNTP